MRSRGYVGNSSLNVMKSQCDATTITCIFRSYGDFSYIVLPIVTLFPTCLPRSNIFVSSYPFISIQTSAVLLVGLLIIHHCRQPPTFLLGALVREAASLAHLYSDTRISRRFLAHHRKPLSQRTRKPPFLVHRNFSEVAGAITRKLPVRRNQKSLGPVRFQAQSEVAS